MPSRQYDIEAENVIPDGFWPGSTLEAEHRSELEALMLDAAAVLERIGGTFSIVAVRREIAPGLFVPDRFVAKWESFAPAERMQRREEPRPAPAPAPEPEPEPEPVQIAVEEAVAEAAVQATEDTLGLDDDFGPDAEQALAGVEQG